MNITLLGIDIAKHVFQLHGIDRHGSCHLKKRLSRDKLLAFTVNLPKCTIVMETRGGSSYWAKAFQKHRHG